MAKIWEPQPIEVYKAWIDALSTEASDTLNDWEMNFIDSISNRLANNHNLTENQANRLETIYAEKTK